MKQRNKETGEIFEVITFGYINSEEPNGNGDYPVKFITLEVIDEEGDLYEFRYKSLKDLNAVWEDCPPSEPDIENEKARKIVRAWAECCHVQVVNHYLSDGNSCFVFTDEKGNDCCLDFTFRIDNLESDADYTIAELCGEEEE